MSYNTKNYTEQGGDVIHIGGELVIDEEASVSGLPSSPVVILPMAQNGDTDVTYGQLWDMIQNQGKLVYFVRDVYDSDVDVQKLFYLLRRIVHTPGSLSGEFTVGIWDYATRESYGSSCDADVLVSFPI